MNFKSIAYIFSVVFLLQSCSEDFFTKTIEVEGDWNGPEVVVEARMDANDDTLSLLLHRSKPVFGYVDDRIDHIAEADVILRGNDGSEYEFSFDTLRDYSRNYYAVADAPLRAGVNYTLVIDHPDFDKVEASATMPQKPILTDYDWDENYRLEVLDSTPYTLLELNYLDNTTGYISHIFEHGYIFDTDTLAGSMNFQSDRFDVGNFRLQDELFDAVSNNSDNQLSILFEIQTRYIEEVKDRSGAHLIIFTQSVTEDDYLFHKSVYEHVETGNVPFVEPVIVYNDIANANGFFSLINSKKFTISFPE